MTRSLIIGGSGDIGQSIVDECLALGNEVILHYNQSDLEQLKHKYAGKPVTFLQMDLTKRVDLNVLNQIGQIDHLIYVAGKSLYGSIQEMLDEEIDIQYHLNVFHLIKAVQLLVDNLRRSHHGRIIVISSIWGETGVSYESIYATMKSAQLGFVKSMAKELALTNITVNAITPGVVRGKMTSELDESTQSQLKEDIPQGKFVLPEEVSSSVAYLLSPLAQSVTGQVLRINGGWYI
nr:SDR family oxidoreductase [Mammaliicoccus sp. Marseille-Q6498]